MMLRLVHTLLICLALLHATSASGMRAPALEQKTAIHSALASHSIETCATFDTCMQLGDEVLAFNEWKPKSDATTDTRLSYEKVVDIYTSYKQQTLVHLTLDNGQQLTATQGHPFKTTDGWRDAVLLKKGGQLLLKGGEGDADAVAADLQSNKPLAQQNNAQAATDYVANNSQTTNAAQPGERAITIADIRLEVTTVAVYNLEVANAHTFFVGVDGVLVHNGFSKTPGKHGHHGYPQQFRDKFAEMGIDVDQHIFDLDPEKHRDLHRGKGCGVGGKWNKAWRDFFNDPRVKKTKATAETYLETLLKQAGL
jgi:Predicted lipoprotein of unknown function (DUF2380)